MLVTLGTLRLGQFLYLIFQLLDSLFQKLVFVGKMVMLIMLSRHLIQFMNIKIYGLNFLPKYFRGQPTNGVALVY